MQEKKKYKNESYKLFDKCEKNENIMFYLYLSNIFLTIAINILGKEQLIVNITNYLIIIINIVYIFIGGYTDIILKNKAESELRKTMVFNSFGIKITNTKSAGYYDNEISASMKKFGINNFESTLYTNMITEKLVFNKMIKFFFLFIMWIFVLIQIKNIEIITLLTQAIFSADIFLDLVKAIYYHITVNKIYDNFYKIFVTLGYEEEYNPLIIENVLEYECLKSYVGIILPNGIFDKEKDKIEVEWEKIKKDIN